MHNEETIRGFICENFLLGYSQSRLGNDDSFLETGVVDSTGILELVSFIEDRFEIQVHDAELVPDNFDSINRLVAYIDKKKNGHPC